uniref:Gfo/Idh/MocA-like oxidoreductase N-terminal domain-containing protein n=1 Tax=Chenopodium quinoa TaxID=63459 RepID=A0A803MSB6_CHEQI
MAESHQPTTIRFGILGCAEIARKVSRAITLSPNSTLYAIGSRSIEKARAYAAANDFLPSTKIYGSYEEVLGDPDVDAVYVPLPTSLHLQWVVRAAEKKKHVLVEKPPALNVKELDVILSASDSQHFGQLKTVHSIFTFMANDDFLRNNIRVQPGLDSLGALGDAAASKTWFTDKALEWTHKSSEHVVRTDLPQEALMVKEFSALVDGVKHRDSAPEKMWPTISRKTQLVIDVVMASIDEGCQPVEVVY